MPLLDHFAPPLSDRRHWHSFHNGWAYCISTQLNSMLPLGYFAEANVQYGIEIDVAAFEDAGATPLAISYTPPAPHATHPTTFTEAVVEVGIFSRSGGPQLAGAVELVSPTNKDRPETRQALVNKCATYIQAGVGVVLVEVGRPLPTMPLWLRGGLCLPVELEATYERTCTEPRLRLTVG
jgi:hypothetical protein